MMIAAHGVCSALRHGAKILRYVNGHRITAASPSLQKGSPMPKAMLDAGFMAKSNFNRELATLQENPFVGKGGAPAAKLTLPD